MSNSMYYSSSSSSEEFQSDDGSQEQTISLHSLASNHAAIFQEIDSSRSTRNDMESETKASLPSDSPSPYPPISRENEEEEDSETISTLKLEEKIVSLMNRVWILETENDVLLSRWKKDGNDDTTIQTMYQDPYDVSSASSAPSGVPNQFDTGLNHGKAIGNQSTLAQTDTLHTDDTTKTDGPSLLEDQNRSLRTDLSISDQIRERMRTAMVELEHRDKIWTKKMEKTRKEKENDAKQYQKSIESLQRAVEAERAKNQKLQNTCDEIKLEKQTLRMTSAAKKFSDGLTALHSSSSTEAAKLISDLSKELNLTMERESKLKVALKEAKSTIAKQSRDTLVSLDKYQREKDVLLKHNDELKSLNVELVHKIDDLERQSNKLFTKLRKLEREKSTHSRASDDMVKMEDYLYTLAMKYEDSQQEIAILKKSLESKDDEISELKTSTRVRSPSEKGSSLTAQDKEIIKASSRIRKQNEHMVRMLYDKEVNDDLSLWQQNKDRFSVGSNKLSFPDEQREEEDFDSDCMFPNRVEI